MKALSGQSLLDLAIQSSGSASAAFALAVANGISLTGEPAGELTAVDVANKAVADYYAARNLMPATAITEAIGDNPSGLAGIEYWIIETDFVVN